MSAVRGFLAGTLTVAAAEALVTSPRGAGQIGAFGDFLTVAIDRVVSPDVPALGSVDFVPPAPFGGVPSKPAKPSKPHRPKQLRSTKAKPPRPVPRGA